MQDHAKQLLANRSTMLQQQQPQQHSVGISSTSKQLLHRVANKKETELRNELFGRVSIFTPSLSV